MLTRFLFVQAALEKKFAEEQASLDSQLSEGEISTELVEEYISIADGQVCDFSFRQSGLGRRDLDDARGGVHQHCERPGACFFSFEMSVVRRRGDAFLCAGLSLMQGSIVSGHCHPCAFCCWYRTSHLTKLHGSFSSHDINSWCWTPAFYPHHRQICLWRKVAPSPTHPAAPLAFGSFFWIRLFNSFPQQQQHQKQ